MWRQEVLLPSTKAGTDHDRLHQVADDRLQPRHLRGRAHPPKGGGGHLPLPEQVHPAHPRAAALGGRLPPVLGGIFALVTPELLQPSLTTLHSQVVFGAVCGFLSTYAYMILKAVLKKNFGVEEPTGREGDSVKPPGGPEEKKDV